MSLGNKIFSSLEAHTLLLLYKSLIWTVLEYGNIVWDPRYKLDQLTLNKVQRCATKLIPLLYNHPYNERLHMLDLLS